MYKVEGSKGPTWFNEKKSLIESLSHGSQKKVKIICPECKNDRLAVFSNITRSGHSFCKGCAVLYKSKLELLGERFGKLTVIGFSKEYYITPSDGSRGLVCLCKCECGKQVEVIASSLRNGHTASCGCLRSEMRSEENRTRVGENHPSYDKNLSQEVRIEREKERSDNKNRVWKSAVKERDHYQCVICGSTEKLEAHHLESFADNVDLRYDIDNGVTLCKSCHIGDYHHFQKQNKLENTKSTMNAFINKNAGEFIKKGKSFITVLEDMFG